MKLNVKKVERASKPGRYSGGYGLVLIVSKTGIKRWALRYERQGKEVMLPLGSCIDFSLSEARQRAMDARRKLADGIDPTAERQKAKAATALAAIKTMSFREAAKQYHAQHEAQWKSEVHSRQFLSSLEAHAFPPIGDLSVADVDTGAVLRVLEPIWLTKTTTASRIRSRIEAVLSWAAVRGLRSSENPARWGGHLKAALPAKGKVAKVVHHAAMPVHEVPSFMAQLAVREGIPSRALEFLILTAARTGEVIGATWDEIDLAKAVWTIPAGRMKASKEHRVPLSERAVALLRELPREAAFVFPGARLGQPIGPQGMSHTLKRILGADAAVTTHGFRSSFRDWCAERTNYPQEVAEAALAHTVKNQVEGAYKRTTFVERRVVLMRDWAAFCSTVKMPAAVVPLRLLER